MPRSFSSFRSQRPPRLILPQRPPEIRLGHLITTPTDGRTRHGRYNPRLPAPHEPAPSILPLDNAGGLPQPADLSDLGALAQAPRLQQRLDDVERRGDAGGESAGQPTGDAVGDGVVCFGGVHDFGHGLVGHELEGGEGHGHGEGGRVGDVEGGEALGAEDLARASGDGRVGTAVDLHALFDDYGGMLAWCAREGEGGGCGQYVPSNGFISASLAIVAHAPDAAAAAGWCLPSRAFPPANSLTTS